MIRNIGEIVRASVDVRTISRRGLLGTAGCVALNARSSSSIHAQGALETGHGKSMCNYHFGGIKGTGPSGLSASYKTKEGWGATEVSINDRFRAYNSPEEGAADYLALLDRRYGNALDAARAGDAAGFVHGLKTRGYFTGNEEVYTRNVVALSQSALNRGFDSIGAKAA